ncbi:MAG: hypothetical protein KDI36_14295, partial [Pseudomonadales bacterium]|nr:hypothetical protein [Pseudomonadales bacterium]
MKTLTLLPRWLFPLAAFRQCLAGLLMVFASAAVTAATTDWQTIEPGGETVCAHGSPYRFFVREADPQKLLVFFQGGGACWSSQNCDLKNRPGFDPFATADDNPATHAAGIFDISNEHNPLQDYSMIFVAYCSGDVHLGNVSRDYPIRDGAGGYDQSLHVEHRGY